MSTDLLAKLECSKSNYARCIGQHENIRKCAAVCGHKRARRVSGKTMAGAAQIKSGKISRNSIADSRRLDRFPPIPSTCLGPNPLRELGENLLIAFPCGKGTAFDPTQLI